MTDRKPLLTGWKKDKYDRRDFLFKPRLAIPDKVSLLDAMPAVRDQGQIGSCVGFGIGANLTALAKRLAVDPEWFSPTWIYNGARFIEGTLPYDEGCFPRNALQWISDKGCLKEHFWPYHPTRLDKTSPPSTLEPEAAKWPILIYSRITGGADGIMAALAAGKPVSIGNPWFDDWMFTDRNGRLPDVRNTTPPAGGHETIIYGYDRTTGYFLCQNSWGTDWGTAGRFQMPMSAIPVFQYQGGYDAHTIDVEWTDDPEPESASVSGSIYPESNSILKYIFIGVAVIAIGAFILSFIL